MIDIPQDDYLNKKHTNDNIKKELKEWLESIPELEKKNFCISWDYDWTLFIADYNSITNNGLFMHENDKKDVWQCPPGEYQYEQIFTYDAAVRETKNVGKKMLTTADLKNIIDKKYGWKASAFVVWENLVPTGVGHDYVSPVVSDYGQKYYLWCEDWYFIVDFVKKIATLKKLDERSKSLLMSVRCIKW